ncbi:MAG: hypothetical protein B6I28_01265 [Fusobacteriia bacterium 4572_132]|nr:MAG: hypothetical protein B6I28_01265 [Fusobacteriia bacterium 4572_132]
MKKKMKKLQKPILAEGEVTGHMHELKSKDVEVFEREDGVRKFQLKKKTKLTHQEHNTIEVETHQNTADIVRQYDPLTEEIRRVAD